MAKEVQAARAAQAHAQPSRKLLRATSRKLLAPHGLADPPAAGHDAAGGAAAPPPLPTLHEAVVGGAHKAEHAARPKGAGGARLHGATLDILRLAREAHNAKPAHEQHAEPGRASGPERPGAAAAAAEPGGAAGTEAGAEAPGRALRDA